MEVINSFFSNIKDKLTNPFFGTLILVLLVHHWELIYVIFNFDDNVTLDKKLLFIEAYIKENITLKILFHDFLYAGGAMIVGYLIVIATRSIVLALEYRIMPFLTGKIVSKNVVLKSQYDNAVKEREEYFDQYEEQRKNVRTFSKTIDAQILQIKQKDEAYLNKSVDYDKKVKDLEILNTRFIDLDKKLKQSEEELSSKELTIEELNVHKMILNNELSDYENLFLRSPNKEFYNTIEKFPPSIIEKVKELKKDDLWTDFIAVGSYYESGGSVGVKTIDLMVEKDIAFKYNSSTQFNTLGKIIWKYRTILKDVLIDLDDI